MREALDLTITGIVQGVGFRPFVYRCAHACNITGWVLNGTFGVKVHAEGEAQDLSAFVMRVHDEAPAAAHIAEISLDQGVLEPCSDFKIVASDQGEEEKTTLVSADLATCAACQAELFDPANRRYRYPFINCTNCGPRFTIIDKLPYDRCNTSMASFPMCDPCAQEYADPLNRRFHAQPDACWDCGPVVSFAEKREVRGEGGEAAGAAVVEAAGAAAFAVAAVPASAAPAATAAQVAYQERAEALGYAVSWGNTHEMSDAIFVRAVELLQAGEILAVKGLGGFHLVCDAENPEALAKLRQRKRREGKPFAVMMKNTEAVREFCQVSADEEQLLNGSVRPIVLLRLLPHVQLAKGLADNLYELGVMLPYTPVQMLLMHDFAAAGGRMLVMTSGNVHDEPIVTSDEQALEALGDIAHAILGNNRQIRARYDDSVVRVLDFGQEAGTALQFVRRARGYAPTPIHLSDEMAGREGECVCATGPEQKTTACFVRETDAFVTQHVGDMENALVNNAWFETLERYEALFNLKPTVLACDKHPEYLTTKWAREQALSRVEVQHHHAHIASVLAENNIQGAALGFAFDGTGYGADGAIWGGEALLCNTADFERFANFVYVPMPGGAAAVKNPLRMAYGALWAYDLLEHPAAQAAFAPLGEATKLFEHMIESGLNTPHTSSVGRLFDAASALLGICVAPAYEGEGAVLLEAAAASAASTVNPSTPASAAPAASTTAAASAATPTSTSASTAAAASYAPDPRYSIAIQKNVATPNSTAHDTSVLLFDAAPTFEALLNDIQENVPADECALRFHNAFIELMVNAAQVFRALYDISTVALSGGVFLNRYIMEHAVTALANAGFTVALNREVPPSDGCISLGQAVVACATNKQTKKE